MGLHSTVWIRLIGMAIHGVAFIEACDGISGNFTPTNSITKARVYWNVTDPVFGIAHVRLTRYVAYSSTPKYLSFAITQQSAMGPVDLVVDCYEVTVGVVKVGTSRNDAAHGNTQDAQVNYRISNLTALKNQTELTCSFVMQLPRAPSYVLLAAGAMAGGAKQKHSERFISEQLGLLCEDQGIKTNGTKSRLNNSTGLDENYSASSSRAPPTSTLAADGSGAGRRISEGASTVSASSALVAEQQPVNGTSASPTASPAPAATAPLGTTAKESADTDRQRDNGTSSALPPVQQRLFSAGAGLVLPEPIFFLILSRCAYLIAQAYAWL